MIVAATGHRPDKLGGYAPAWSERRLILARRWLEVVRPERVISGMALGWDQAWAQAAVDLGIPFVAAVPFAGQERAWPPLSQDAFARLLARAAEVVIVSPGGFSGRAMQVRNEWMVDRCDLVAALWDGSSGGTANCVHYAERVGRPIVHLWGSWVKLIDGHDNNKVSYPQ
jgi:hypothetical protein